VDAGAGGVATAGGLVGVAAGVAEREAAAVDVGSGEAGAAAGGSVTGAQAASTRARKRALKPRRRSTDIRIARLGRGEYPLTG
jgi:hypothetical protein